MTGEYSRRQLCALAVASLAAPLATACAAAGWQWVLLGAALAGAVLSYIIEAGRRVPPGIGYAQLVRKTYRGGGPWVLGAYWLWLVLDIGMTAAMAGNVFPEDRAFPLIPLTLLLLAALPAAKGAGVTCRFGATLYLAVAGLLIGALAFGAADIHAENLRPAGSPAEALGALTVLLTPAAGWFLRDGLDERPAAYRRWFAVAAGLAAAISLVTVGALGLPLAQAVPNPFWLMSRSISVFGVMERFEAVISAVLAISSCCFLAFHLSVAQRALQSVCPGWGEAPTVWTTAAAAAAAMWGVQRLPRWVWPGGNLLFWGLLPALTLEIAVRSRIK